MMQIRHGASAAAIATGLDGNDNDGLGCENWSQPSIH